MAERNISNLTMHLFGMPYQFPKAVDPRMSVVSSSIGKKFTENIMLEAPVCTIIPGNPSYLPGKKKSRKRTTAQALIQGSNGDFSALKQLFKDMDKDELRLYDFSSAYTEYMKYVNVLCRAGATFLELNETSEGLGTTSSFQRYDWKAYRWNKNAQTSFISRVGSLGSGKKFNMKSKDKSADSGKLNEVFKNFNYVQFYIDPDVSPSESLNNSTGESMVKSMLDNGSSTIKEISFMANSGGIDTKTLSQFTSSSISALQSGVSSILGDSTVAGSLSRIINLGSDVLKGNNIIIPDVYQNSQYTKSYQITVHLKSPYGTKLGYYMDVFVPMMHLLALAMPRQQSANAYGSPFLVKAYVDSVFTCNLGIVDSISINKISDSWSVAGLPSEVDVTLSITDLYCDLMMTPSSSPIQFINNSSLIEYLATNCGIDITAPNYKAKWNNVINSTVAAFNDIPTTVKSSVEEKIYRAISSVTSLY